MPPPGYKIFSVKEEQYRGLIAFAGQLQYQRQQIVTLSDALETLLEMANARRS